MIKILKIKLFHITMIENLSLLLPFAFFYLFGLIFVKNEPGIVLKLSLIFGQI